jgi:hypothetical protein
MILTSGTKLGYGLSYSLRVCAPLTSFNEPTDCNGYREMSESSAGCICHVSQILALCVVASVVHSVKDSP